MAVKLADYNRETALKQWAEASSYWDEVYAQAQDDYKFSLGLNQWESNDLRARRRRKQITLTLNQLDPYANNVVNDILQARMSVKVSPVDSDADIDTAEVLQGIIRNIEKNSRMPRVMSTCVGHAVRAGIGWARVVTDYADVDTFDQEATIEAIEDFTSVYIDPVSCGTLSAEPEYAFVKHHYSKERFEELYPDAQPISFADAQNGSLDDGVTVVEYYLRCYKADRLYKVMLVDGSIQTINREQKKRLDDDGTVQYEIIDERRVRRPYIKIFLLNGEEKPIDESEFPANIIPIIPFFAKRVIVDGKVEYHSLIRQARDAQVMFNYWKSASTHYIKLQSKASFIAPRGSFESQGDKWAKSNVEDYPVLEYDVVYDVNNQALPGPQRQPPIQGSPTLIAEAEAARKDVMYALGMPEASMGYRTSEISGVALRARQIEGDNAVYHIIDNVSESVAQIGRVLVGVIPQIMSDSQIARITGEDGQDENVPVNVPFVNNGGQLVPSPQGMARYDGIYRLGVGKYDVECDVGPSYASRRQEIADKLIQIMQIRPEAAPLLGDVFFDSLDLGAEGKRIAKRLRAQMPPEMLEDDPVAAKLAAASQALEAMQKQLADYELRLQVKAENEQFNQTVELKKLEMQRDKLAIEAQKTAAEIEKMRAETKGFNVEAMQALSEALGSMNAQLADMGRAMEIMLQPDEDGEDAEMPEPLENAGDKIEGIEND